MRTLQVFVHDPETGGRSLFWVSVPDDPIELETEELVILRCLLSFCRSRGIGLLEAARMEVEVNEWGSSEPPIMIQTPGNA